MTAADHAVEFEDVRKSFGATKAVDGLSFAVARGEMFGVIGPDGAGKTTSLRLICGLLAPDVGRVRLFGVEPFVDRRTATSSIGYLSQRFSLYGDLSIDENVAFFAEIHGVRDFASRRARLLDLTGLTRFRDRLADHLSGGMKQKLALACTLVHEPRMLVLDEPTTGVDPVSRREFWKLLAEFLGEGLTIIMATPYLDEAERCGRVALVNQGRLLALEDPKRLITSMHGTILEVVATPVRDALHALRERLGRERVQLFGDRLHVRVEAPGDAGGVAAELERAGFAGAHVRPIVPTLEDVFIEQLAGTRS
ncbi:MAG TPA: ABC transporter ATP-binding protein [Vicinamibacterales bacterium]|nr:ABC transporter ATP-binding protein [Vicinamibacterales bacterium]